MGSRTPSEHLSDDQLAAQRLASYPPLTADVLDQLAMIMHGKHYDELPEPAGVPRSAA